MCVHKNPKSPHKHKINHHLPYKHLHQLKMRNWLKKKRIKIKTMSHLKKKTSIKGEMKLINKRRMNKRFKIKDHRTPRVHQAIQRDHPVNSILDDIHKVVTTRS